MWGRDGQGEGRDGEGVTGRGGKGIYMVIAMDYVYHARSCGTCGPIYKGYVSRALTKVTASIGCCTVLSSMHRTF